MKRLLIILSLVGILLVGCVTSVGLEDIEIASPWFTYLDEKPDFQTFSVYPAKVSIGELYPEAVVDTWTSDGWIEENPNYKWQKGDPTTINIHSAYSEPILFVLTYYVMDSETVDGGTGLTYEPAPKAARAWVTLATTSIVIPPYAIAHVPIMIIIPESAEDLPRRWEFRIRVSDTGQTGQVVADSTSRWLITMRE